SNAARLSSPALVRSLWQPTQYCRTTAVCGSGGSACGAAVVCCVRTVAPAPTRAAPSTRAANRFIGGIIGAFRDTKLSSFVAERVGTVRTVGIVRRSGGSGGSGRSGEFGKPDTPDHPDHPN